MRLVIQRVKKANVTVRNRIIGEIDEGLLILAGIHQNDTKEIIEWGCKKITRLRIFEDEQGKTNLSVLDVKGEAIVVSQFTLYADTRKGRRPSFIDAALPDVAEPLVDRFVERLRGHGVPTQTGKFGNHMHVEIHNDGPVTIWLER